MKLVSEYCFCDFDIFKRMGTIGAKDGFFVAFAENKDEIAFFGFTDC